MKKAILLGISLALFSCSKNENEIQKSASRGSQPSVLK